MAASNTACGGAAQQQRSRKMKRTRRTPSSSSVSPRWSKLAAAFPFLLTARTCLAAFVVISRNSPPPHSPSSSSSSRRPSLPPEPRPVPLSAAASAVGGGGDVVELKHTEFKPAASSAAAAADDDEELEPPAIILHGLLGSKRNFASLGSALAAQLKRRRRVIAVDLRNHGDNRHDWRDDMSYGSMARDVLAVMDREGFDRAVLIGHSMGGKVAKACALLEPHRVAGLVVMDIAPVAYSEATDACWGAVKGAVDALAGVSLTAGKTKRDVDMDLRPTLQDPALRAFALTNLEQNRDTGELQWKINIDAISAQLDTIAGFDVHGGDDDGGGGGGSRSQLLYEGDTFFIHGGASRFVNKHAHVQLISEYFPNYMLTSIRGAGHWIHAEAPDDTLALLKRYLDR